MPALEELGKLWHNETMSYRAASVFPVFRPVFEGSGGAFQLALDLAHLPHDPDSHWDACHQQEDDEYLHRSMFSIFAVVWELVPMDRHPRPHTGQYVY